MEDELAQQPNLDQDDHDEQMLEMSDEQLEKMADKLASLYLMKKSQES